MGYMPDENAVVLVADSEASVLRNVSSTLEKAGFIVLSAHGTPALLNVCAHFHGQIQLAILDMALSTSGSDVLDRLYASYPGIRILFTSAEDESASVLRFGRSGHMRDFLQKPFRRSQLLGRVLEVMDTPMVITA
jgi:CheY-like chemotaxis protein